MQLLLPAITAVARRPAFRVIAGLGVTQVIGWGTTFSALAILGTAIGQDLGLSRKWVFAGITVTLLVSALTAPRVGRRVDRLGARLIMVAGSLLGGIAMLVMANAAGPVSYLLAWALLGIATPMMLGNAAMPGLVQAVGSNARQAIASLMLITGLTSTVFFPVNAWLLGTVGWRGAFLVFAALHVFVCAPLHWLVLKPGSGRETAASSTPPRRSFPPEGVLLPEQRYRGFVLLAVWLCTEGLITWGLNLQIIDVLVRSGLTLAQAIGVWAIVGPCQSLARLGEILSGGRHSILSTMLTAAVFTSLAFGALMVLGLSVPVCIGFCICLGIGHGLFAIARNTLPLALFGAKEFGTYMGLLSTPQNVVNAAAPLLFAHAVAEWSAGSALQIAAVSAWTGLVAVWLLVAYCRKAMHTRGIEV